MQQRMSKPEREDVSELVHNDELDDDSRNFPNRAADDSSVVFPEYVNPALEDTESAGKRDTEGTGNLDSNSSSAQNENGGRGGATISSVPVHYNSQTGETCVIQEPVVIRQPNGMHVIRTRECCHQPNNYRRERPLKLKHIKFLKIFSIAAIVVFFPLGFLAMYYAFKSEKEFHAGILRGDLDLARKFAKRSERLMIFSVMAALLIAVAVFAIVERNLMANDEEYWKTRNSNMVLPSG